jgi:hypothetical protein
MPLDVERGRTPYSHPQTVPSESSYSVRFLCAAQRFRCPSAMRLRPSAEMRCFFLVTGAVRLVAERLVPLRLPNIASTFVIAAVIRASSYWYPSNAASKKDWSCRAIDLNLARDSRAHRCPRADDHRFFGIPAVRCRSRQTLPSSTSPKHPAS